MQFRSSSWSFVLPNGYIAEVCIVTFGFIFLCLALFAEVTTTGLFAMKGVAYHELTELKEVGNTTGALKRTG